jgi:hypothetical protein
MLQLGAAARRIGRLVAVLAGLAVVAACGSVAASHARTGSASSPPPGSPVARTSVKHFDFLNGVSCASPTNCTAVGQDYRTASGAQLTLIERWNGRAWRVEPSPSIGRGSTLCLVAAMVIASESVRRATLVAPRSPAICPASRLQAQLAERGRPRSVAD